jgi:acetyl/propionyl-CoA carboxylase alpha subunit
MTIPVEYDPMLAKLAAWGPTRDVAIARLRTGLGDTVALGPSTNLAFLADVLDHPAFQAGETHTGFIDAHLHPWRQATPDLHDAALAAALAATSALPFAPGASASATLPTPWERLGAWRVGA